VGGRRAITRTDGQRLAQPAASAAVCRNGSADREVSSAEAVSVGECREVPCQQNARYAIVHPGAGCHRQANAGQTRRDQGDAEPHGHRPAAEQGCWPDQVMRGYLAYHAVPTNARKITSFHHHVVWHWRRALSRCSQKAAVPWRRTSGRTSASHRTLVPSARWGLL